MVDWFKNLKDSVKISLVVGIFVIIGVLWNIVDSSFINKPIDEKQIQAMVEKAIEIRLAQQPVKNHSENEIETIKKVLTKLLRSNEQDRKRAGVLFTKGDTEQAIKILSKINQKETEQINSQQQLTKQQIAQNTETKL